METVAIDPAEKNSIRLEGTTRFGAIRVELEEVPTPLPPGKATSSSLRLHHLFAHLPSPRGPVVDDDRPTVDLAFTPIAPGDPATWAIEVKGRRRVESLTQLRPAPGDTLIGQKFPLGSITAPHRRSH